MSAVSNLRLQLIRKQTGGAHGAAGFILPRRNLRRFASGNEAAVVAL
jgi:hypothetical protein